MYLVKLKDTNLTPIILCKLYKIRLHLCDYNSIVGDVRSNSFWSAKRYVEYLIPSEWEEHSSMSCGTILSLQLIAPATETGTSSVKSYSNIHLNGEIAIERILTRSVGCVPLAAASCSRFSSSSARRCCLLTDSTSFIPRCCCSAILRSAASACFLRIVSWGGKRATYEECWRGKFCSVTERREIIFERQTIRTLARGETDKPRHEEPERVVMVWRFFFVARTEDQYLRARFIT